MDGNISWHHADATTEPSSWMVGSDVIVVDPPRKGLEASAIAALQSISLKEKSARSSHAKYSGHSTAKEERRPWILRAREAAVHFGSNSGQENDQSLPQILIYISCGWESFKEDCKTLVSRTDWHLHKVHGFNFFPGTQRVEVLVIFKRGQSSQTGKKNAGKKKIKKKLS